MSCSTRLSSSASGPLPLRAARSIAASRPRPASTQIVSWSSTPGKARSISFCRSRPACAEHEIGAVEAGDGEHDADEEHRRRRVRREDGDTEQRADRCRARASRPGGARSSTPGSRPPVAVRARARETSCAGASRRIVSAEPGHRSAARCGWSRVCASTTWRRFGTGRDRGCEIRATRHGGAGREIELDAAQRPDEQRDGRDGDQCEEVHVDRHGCCS